MDGAMGTSIQKYNLQESNFRGEEFKSHTVKLSGNYDLLNLIQPEIIQNIHQSYIEAGADIITTNTFNSNIISQATYQCQGLVYRLNTEGARIAREVADHSGRTVFVAGSIGPTGKALSLLPEAYREADFNELLKTYREQVEGLMDGGADLLLVETVFDVLNAQAALSAIAHVQQKKARNIPVMLSVTLNENGRTLSGQTPEEIYSTISSYPLLSFGLNCSFGSREMQIFIEKLSRSVPCYLSIYPNAGLPDKTGKYHETQEHLASVMKDMGKRGLINIAGGCCGTTPEHIAAMAESIRGISPRLVKT